MITILRTDSNKQDFINLVKFLDTDLAIRDDDEHTFYNQLNKIDGIKHAVAAYQSEQPLGCGAIKEYEPTSM